MSLINLVQRTTTVRQPLQYIYISIIKVAIIKMKWVYVLQTTLILEHDEICWLCDLHDVYQCCFGSKESVVEPHQLARHLSGK